MRAYFIKIHTKKAPQSRFKMTSAALLSFLCLLHLAHRLAGDRVCKLLFFVAHGVAAHELVDATCGVDELLLAGEEGV